MFKITPIILIIFFTLTNCSTTPRVSYEDSKSVETVTSSFGSTDLNQIAEAMARSLLQAKVVYCVLIFSVITLVSMYSGVLFLTSANVMTATFDPEETTFA